MNQVASIGYNHKLKDNEKKCLVCDAFFRRRGQRKFTAKFCSNKCKGEYLTGKSLTRIKGVARKSKCKKCKKIVPFYQKYCSRNCYFGSIGGWNSGENHPMWKGGVKPENQKLRSSRRYKNWRTKVFRRDDYTCQICGERGGKLEADHIKSWAKYKKLRFVVSNGRTLCKDCHKKTPNYKRNG